MRTETVTICENSFWDKIKRNVGVMLYSMNLFSDSILFGWKKKKKKEENLEL